MAKRIKQRIKYIYIIKNRTSNMLYVSLLTTTYEYVEFEFSILKNCITNTLAFRIRSLFSDFQIDSNTHVLYDDELSKMHPLYIYFTLIHQHIDFNFRNVSVDQIIRRIQTYHKYFNRKLPVSKINRNFLNKIWNKLVQLEKCPWITTEVDGALRNFSAERMKLKRICRLALYYLVIKEYFMKFSK